MKIYLTIDVNVDDDCFDNLVGFTKVDYDEIYRKLVHTLSQNGEAVPIFPDRKIRCQHVADEILKSKSNLLIGHAVSDQNDLQTILNTIKDSKKRITRLYFDDGRRRRSKQKKYEESYALHSRWLDYSPQFVAQKQIEFDRKVDEIKQLAGKHNIELGAV